jgi:hypothetical protein
VGDAFVNNQPHVTAFIWGVIRLSFQVTFRSGVYQPLLRHCSVTDTEPNHVTGGSLILSVSR